MDFMIFLISQKEKKHNYDNYAFQTINLKLLTADLYSALFAGV